MKDKNIVGIAYMPVARLGSVENERLWNHEGLEAISQRHGKSKVQVILNWAVERGTVPIPRSSSAEHI